MYHTPTDTLYHYVKGVFYSHSQEAAIDDNDDPFKLHYTQQPLPNKYVRITWRLEMCNVGLITSVESSAIADDTYITLYESKAMDFGGVMQSGINAVKRSNLGCARSPALMEASSIVQYWRTQLTAVHNNVCLSTGTKSS